MKVFLVGYRGAGKTTVGRLLAKELGIPFYDLDDEITKIISMTIANYVNLHGWGAFREIERESLREFMNSSRSFVLACGGGAIMHEDLWQNMHDGKVIYLSCDKDILINRLRSESHASKRPPLTAHNDLVKEVDEMLSKRIPLYKKYAQLTLDTSNLTVSEAVKELLRLLR